MIKIGKKKNTNKNIGPTLFLVSRGGKIFKEKNLNFRPKIKTKKIIYFFRNLRRNPFD